MIVSKLDASPSLRRWWWWWLGCDVGRRWPWARAGRPAGGGWDQWDAGAYCGGAVTRLHPASNNLPPLHPTAATLLPRQHSSCLSIDPCR